MSLVLWLEAIISLIFNLNQLFSNLFFNWNELIECEVENATYISSLPPTLDDFIVVFVCIVYNSLCGLTPFWVLST